MRVPAIAAVLTGLGLAAQGAWAQPQTRPIKRPPNNELDLVDVAAPVRVDPPGAVLAATERLVFHTSPLSSRGLLSEQVRDALKALDKANGGAVFLKLRAFVAGTGDMRRVAAIVTEEFTDKKWPLPAITTVLVGGLPLENAQVVIEAVSEEKSKSVNPGGLAFLSAQEGATAEEAVAKFGAALKAAGAEAARITCFSESMQGAEAARLAAAKAFPRVPGAFMQLTRYNLAPRVACEGIGRLPRRAAAGIRRVEAPGLGPAAAVIVARPKLVFTAAQLAFRDGEEDIRLAYQRLARTIQDLGVSYDDVVASHVYSLSGEIEERVTGMQQDFVSAAAPPARSAQVLEGLPSLDATAAVEIVAVAR
jgi:enamine deaminase RidA (YjgF/YER057c/UK114 family)